MKKMAAGPSRPGKRKRSPTSRPQPGNGSDDQLFESLAEPLLTGRAVTAARMFGSTCLKVRGKVFAVGYKGRLVLKLPADRVELLVNSGAGVYFDPGHGRTSKQWVSVAPESKDAWPKLAVQARDYVASLR